MRLVMPQSKETAAIYGRQWRERNPEYHKRYMSSYNKTHGRRNTLKYRYGITEEDVLARLVEQNGCAICHIENAKKWCVDHDHGCCPTTRKTCGKCVRGILCDPCNVGIAKLKDSPTIMAAAIEYLTRGESGRHGD